MPLLTNQASKVNIAVQNSPRKPEVKDNTWKVKYIQVGGHITVKPTQSNAIKSRTDFGGKGYGNIICKQ